MLKNIFALVVLAAALILHPSTSAADLLDELSGKNLECEPSDGSYPVGWGYNRFFFSKKGKMIWTASEIMAGEGTTVALKKPTLLKRTSHLFVISAANMDNKQAKLTFEKSGKSISLKRSDKNPSGQPMPTEVCSVKGGIENTAKQQINAVLGMVCSSDIFFSCTVALVKYCTYEPTETCRAKYEKRIAAYIESSNIESRSSDDAVSEMACELGDFGCNSKLLKQCGEHPTAKCWKLNRININ